MNNSPFKHAVGNLLQTEGGFVNHPSDSGGPTKFGITLNWYKSVVDSEATVEYIKRLTYNDAKQLYRTFWWDDPEYCVIRGGYGNLPDGVSEIVFNASVNMGSYHAHKLLQKSLRSVGFSLAVDGYLGPVTVRCAKAYGPKILIKEMASQMILFYNQLVQRGYGEEFYEGWLHRAITTAIESNEYLNAK